VTRGRRECVIDTTLLSRLAAAELADLLPLVFDMGRIPTEVEREVRRGPGRARQRLNNMVRASPEFFVRCVEHDAMVLHLLEVDLDRGEAAVIAQADETGAVAIIDERAGYARAELMQVEVRRSGSILVDLKAAGAITAVKPALDRLKSTGFRLSDAAFREILALAGEEP
jgi:predicted nucleic acid-binding protein